MHLDSREVSSLLSEKRVIDWIKRGILRADAVNHQYQLYRSDLLERASSTFAPRFFRPPNRTGNAYLRWSIPFAPKEFFTDRVLLSREAIGSTAMGEGIGILHVRRPILVGGSKASISLYLLECPIDFDALDGRPVFAIFLILSPTARIHLQLLSGLSLALHDSELKAALARCAPSAEITAHFQRAEDMSHRRERTVPSES